MLSPDSVQLGLISGVSGSALSVAANLAETSLNIGIDFPGGTHGTQFRFELGYSSDSTYEPPLSVIVYRGGETDGAGTADSGFDAPGNLSDAIAAPDTDSASANGLPTQEVNKLTNVVQNTGTSDGVSRGAAPSPTDTLVALAAAVRDAADITLPTQGSEGTGSESGSGSGGAGSGSGGDGDAVQARGSSTGANASGVMVSQGALSLPGGSGTGSAASGTNGPAAADASVVVSAGVTSGSTSSSTSGATSDAPTTSSSLSSSGNSGTNGEAVKGSGSSATSSPTNGTIGTAISPTQPGVTVITGDADPADDPPPAQGSHLEPATTPPGGLESPTLAALGGFFGNIWDRATYVPRTVWANTGTSDYSLPGRVYVTAGTTLGSVVGVTQVSDAGAQHAAVDAHPQSTGERVFNGVSGGVQLLTVGAGVGLPMVKAIAGKALAKAGAVGVGAAARETAATEGNAYARFVVDSKGVITDTLAPNTAEVANPAAIRFTQPTASPNFSTGGHTIQSTLEELKAGKPASSLPTIRVVEHEGQLFTLDNRRLVTFQNAGLDEIPIQRLSMTDPAVAKEFLRKFNPIDGGTKIVITPNSDRAATEALLRQMGKIK
jgi:hypothetical protein